MPVAVLRYRVKNPNKQAAKVSIAFSLDNPAGSICAGSCERTGLCRRSASNEFRSGPGLQGLFMTNPKAAQDDPVAGSMALCVLDDGKGDVTYLRGWPRAKWWASPLLFWDDFSEDGKLGPEPAPRNAVGSVCLQREIAAGRGGRVHLPAGLAFPQPHAGLVRLVGAQGRREHDHRQLLREALRRRLAGGRVHRRQLPSLEKRMRQFLTAMRETTLPAPVKEAAMANVSTLATPICFRTADGKFRGFEGANDASGCCFGNCTHVWNYESVTQHLFPTLARSQRNAAFDRRRNGRRAADSRPAAGG